MSSPEGSAGGIVLRAATAVDGSLLLRMIGLASQWRERHPEPERATGPDTYVDGFGRSGDLGVVAETDGADGGADGRVARAVGAAWLRSFREPERRAGFVAEDVPELAMAVDPECRGAGVGRRLLERLLADAAAGGFRAVSLHVSAENARARALYESFGFRVVDTGTKPVVMLRMLHLGRDARSST